MTTLANWTLAYQKSPIIFVGGIAQNMPGNKLPIISITQSTYFPNGVVGSSTGLDLNSFFFDFEPVSGSKLCEYTFGTYPFLNQNVAANAVIGQPLGLALKMLAPLRVNSNYDNKQAVISNLKTVCDQHASMGGTYTVSTPSYVYQNCLLNGIQDYSDGDPQRPQSQWLWTFTKPLLTLNDALSAQNALMSRFSNGLQVTPNANGEVPWSSTQNAVGQSGVGTPVPAAQGQPGATIGSYGLTYSTPSVSQGGSLNPTVPSVG